MRKITDSIQKVVADILIGLSFCKDMIDVDKYYDVVFQSYNLHLDPFVGLPCSSKEYEKSCLEYDRQRMIEKYGHCDGLD